jgi:hypothetical protein
MPQLDNVITIAATLAGAYFACSTLISILLEVFAQITGRRARFLRRHLVRVLGHHVSKLILTNALVRKLPPSISGSHWGKAKRRMKGLHVDQAAISYIEPRDFALALLHETFERDPSRPTHLVLDPSKLGAHSAHVKNLISTLLEGTSGNPAHIQERIEVWFRRDQEQLTASYGVSSRSWGILLGTLTAMLVGLDTIAFVLQCEPSAYHCLDPISRFRYFETMQYQIQLRLVLSYVIGGLMISQGASFWFDIITRFTNIRGEVAKPRGGTA